MDFVRTEDQQSLADLAADVFGRFSDPQHIAAVEAGPDAVDHSAWKSLAEAGLLGVGIPEQYGGIGLGLIESCLVLEQQGRSVVPVPLWPSLVAAAPIARFGTEDQRTHWLPRLASGTAFATAALAEPGIDDGLTSGVIATLGADGWTLSGAKPAVPAGQVADMIVVPARTGGTVSLFLLDPTARGVERTPSITTNREVHAHLALDDAPAELLTADADALPWLHDRAQVALAAVQLGVAEEALQRAAAYLTTREQFGLALGSLQGPQLRAADAYIDVEAMRCTMWQAAWLLDEGRAAEWQVRSAKWWAAEAGQRVVHAAQHLHGGIGADVDYPVHRYFLWGKQIENMMGSASSQLAALGELIAR